VFDYIAIFVALFCVDVIWTLYIRAVSKGKAFKASVLSAVVYGLSAFSFFEVVKDINLLLPAVLGSFSGTFATMKWEMRNKK